MWRAEGARGAPLKGLRGVHERTTCRSMYKKAGYLGFLTDHVFVPDPLK